MDEPILNRVEILERTDTSALVMALLDDKTDPKVPTAIQSYVHH